MKIFKKILIGIVVVLVAAYPLFFGGGMSTGPSMEPTIHDGTYTLKVRVFNIQRFDIVTISEDGNLLKRIIGLPGETISCKDNVIYINGNPLEEAFLDETFVKESIKEHGFFTPDFDEITLGDDEYFYLGDNRPESGDSTEYGPCKKNQIVGKLIFKIKL